MVDLSGDMALAQDPEAGRRHILETIHAFVKKERAAGRRPSRTVLQETKFRDIHGNHMGKDKVKSFIDGSMNDDKSKCTFEWVTYKKEGKGRGGEYLENVSDEFEYFE